MATKRHRLKRKARGTKKLNTLQRQQKEYAKEYKKTERQIKSLQKKLPKEEIKLGKLEEKRDKDVMKHMQKIEGQVSKIATETSNLQLLQTSLEEIKPLLSYSGLALL